MVLKLEDCFNILKALHPGIDFIFLFDHSCGHDRGRKYGLNIKNMNSGYGRVQQKMQTANINQKFGYLSAHQ